MPQIERLDQSFTCTELEIWRRHSISTGIRIIWIKWWNRRLSGRNTDSVFTVTKFLLVIALLTTCGIALSIGPCFDHQTVYNSGFLTPFLRNTVVARGFITKYWRA